MPTASQARAPRATVEVVGPDEASPSSAPRSADPLNELEQLARLMDTAFEIPGLGVKFGLDALIGLIPGLGDTLTGLVSLYIIGAASRFGLPRVTLMRMGANVALDWLFGCIPFVGDLFDVAWKANRMNVDIVRRHLADVEAGRRHARVADWFFVVGLLGVLTLLLIGIVTSIVFALRGLSRLLF